MLSMITTIIYLFAFPFLLDAASKTDVSAMKESFEMSKEIFEIFGQLNQLAAKKWFREQINRIGADVAKRLSIDSRINDLNATPTATSVPTCPFGTSTNSPCTQPNPTTATTLITSCPFATTTTKMPCPFTTSSSLTACTGCTASSLVLTGNNGVLTSFSSATAPNGCQLLVIVCPASTRYNIIYANGGSTSNLYTTPILLNCSNTASSSLLPADADDVVQLHLFGAQLAASANFWVDAINGLQVVGSYCSSSVVSTATTIAATTTNTIGSTCASNCSPTSITSTAEYASNIYNGCQTMIYACNLGYTMLISFADALHTVSTQTYIGAGLSVSCLANGSWLASSGSCSDPPCIVSSIACVPPTSTSTSTSPSPSLTITQPVCPYATSLCTMSAITLSGNVVTSGSLVNVTNRCPELWLTCTPGSMYALSFTDGTSISELVTNSTQNVSLYCINAVWQASNGKTGNRFQCQAPATISMILTTPTTSTSRCNTCLRSQIDPRLDFVTTFTTSIVGGCLQAATSCVGQANPLTPNLKYHIVYADSTVEDFTITANANGPTFLCNSNGIWLDVSDGKEVSTFFCYETSSVNDCVQCTSHTSPTIFNDINVPLYNRSNASPNQCCNVQAFVASNTTALLSTLVNSATPSNAGLIGTANCSNTGASQLCICGFYNSDSQTMCWFGDSNVYVLEYCNATTSACSITTIPFTNAIASVISSGISLLVPTNTNDDQFWGILYPAVSLITCATTVAQCAALSSVTG